MGVQFDVSAHVTTAQKARLLGMIRKISTEGDRLSAYRFRKGLRLLAESHGASRLVTVVQSGAGL
jgi:hypothetical protein